MSKIFTFFIHLKALPTWLALPREYRNNLGEKTIQEILKKYKFVKVRWYDAEAFNARASDIAVFETSSLQEYYFVIDALRDSEIFSTPYFELVEIIPAVEDGYIEYGESL
jgi:hypothetical protein